jgi:hypothetical protein
MSKIIIFSVLLFSNSITMAQSSFFTSYTRSSHERTFSAVEMENGSFLVAGEIRESGYYGINQGYIAKLAPSGVIENELLMNPVDVSRFCVLIPYKYENSDFLCIGATDSIAGSDTYGRIVFCGLDTNLNITFQKKFSFCKDYLRYPWQYSIANDSILYLLSDYIIGSKNVIANRHIDVVKYKMPFDSLAAYFEVNYSVSEDLIFKHSSMELDLFVFPTSTVLQLDENLNFLSSAKYSDKFPTNVSVTSIGDTNYLLTGSAWNFPSTNLQIGCIRYNKDDISIDSLFYTPSSDTNFYAGGRENTAINGNTIFITGFYNVNAWMFPYNYNPSWVTITKADFALNMISTHFYGGDAQYCPFSVIPTSDGGCLVNGYSYDYLNNLPLGEYELDMFVLKVNSDGLITELPGHPEAKAHDAILYPNPGREFLNIQSGPQINGALFTLYDMQGRPVLEERINKIQLKLNTSNLPAGVYAWQIVFKNKVIESGKWVKE